MSASGVTGYAAVNAQVRALYSSMLSMKTWKTLCEAGDFDNLIAILKQTAYAPYLTALEENELTPRRAVYEIKKHLANAYTTVSFLIPSHVRPLITQLYRLYDVDNLKAVLRGVMIGESWQKVNFKSTSYDWLVIAGKKAM